MRLCRLARTSTGIHVPVFQTIKPNICHLLCGFFLLVMKTLIQGSSTNASLLDLVRGHPQMHRL